MEDSEEATSFEARAHVLVWLPEGGVWAEDVGA